MVGGIQMKEDRLNELLEQSESPIERKLLRNLYRHLTVDRACELRAQYKIDYFDDMSVTVPDFAFPDMQIAIYCDGFKWRTGNWHKFRTDRRQSRELQLRGWIVLRFAGSEIYSNGEMVTDTIQRAIARRERQQAWWDQQQQTLVLREEKKSWQEPMSERRNEKEKTIPVGLDLHSGQRPQKFQTQQKPGGGLCGIIFLTFVIVGIFGLLNFIF